jgi:hypothetical protein
VSYTRSDSGTGRTGRSGTQEVAAALEIVTAACHGFEPLEQYERARTVLAEHDPVLVVTALGQLTAAFLTRCAQIDGTDPDHVIALVGLLHAATTNR